MSVDTFTAFLRGGLRFLMMRSPLRTSMGAAGGVLAGLLLNIFKPVLLHVTWVDLSAITDLRLAVSGVFIANLPGLFQRDRLPEAIEEQFSIAARCIKEGKLSQAHARIFYAKIVTIALENAKLSAVAQREVDLLSSEATTERPRRSRTRATPS
jgi:hypothetical protein